ncbi:MAG: outer membrane protein assembly factor BamE [Gammaproteobacteria bacterium]|nr:outer membrane protein assembly factor BamE [Gammaproteobacteria bacterium]
MRKNLIIIGLIAISPLSACTSILPEAHKIEIQQGNRVKPEDLAKIKPGMTRKQVKFVLGTPLLQDSFHANRWDYIYHLKPGREPLKQSHISLFFDGDTLIRIDDSRYAPEMQQDEVKLEQTDAAE